MKQKKRKLDLEAPLENQLKGILQGIPKLDVQTAREFLQLLHADDKHTGRGTGHKRKQLFPEALATMQPYPLDVAHPRRQMWMVSLPALLQRKVDSCALFRECFRQALQKRCFRQALQKRRNHLEVLIYWDEAVPGNPLSPDLARKSALWYVGFPDFPVVFLDTCWLTLACCRTEDLQQTEEGYCKAMTKMLRALVNEVKDGFAITFGEDAELVCIRKISFLADGDGIRACTGSKGASGKKCCFRCTNVLSGNHIAVPGHEHISSHAVENFEASSIATICSIATYLRGIHVASARAKAETMLGWKAAALQESFLLDPDLKSWIGLSDILYDPMHCFVSNGIVNQEVGMWWTHVLNKSQATLQHFQQYVATCWSQSGPDIVDTKKITSCKLLQPDRDYRGDAGETLAILPLAVAFSQEVLVAVYPDLSLEIQSLMALHEVILAWLACKHHPSQEMADELGVKQKKHAKGFVATYGWEVVRPKLHFSLHLPQQFADKGHAPDAFATERKHRYFKNTVAQSVRRISDFTSAALLKLTEYDINVQQPAEKLFTQLIGQQHEMSTIATFCSAKKAIVASRVEHCAVVYGQGQFYQIDSDVALAVCGAARIDSDFFILGKELRKKSHVSAGFSNWTQCAEEICILPLPAVVSAVRARYNRCTVTANNKDFSLLLG